MKQTTSYCKKVYEMLKVLENTYTQIEKINSIPAKNLTKADLRRLDKLLDRNFSAWAWLADMACLGASKSTHSVPLKGKGK